MNKLLNNFWTRLGIVLFMTIACVLLIGVHNWLWLPIAIFAWLWSVWKLYQLFIQNNRKVAFLLDAIENDDPAVRFYEKINDKDNSQVNRMLNRVARILYNAKIDTVQREKYYELILDFVETGIVVLNAKGAVHQKNRKATELLGLEVFTHIKQLASVSVELQEIFTTSKPGDKFQTSFTTEQGHVHLLMRVSGITIKDEQLRIIALSDINRELDEREIDSWIRLTRVLTHEIMNSLSPVTSLSETLLTLSSAQDEEMHQGLETIHTTGKGLINFVKSYRQLTRLPSPEPNLFYVEPFLQRMVQLARHQHPSSHISIDLHRITDGLILYTDEHLLTQVVTNLLKNAMQAIGDAEGHIRLSAYRQGEKTVRIEIANDGPRIPDEMTEQIFVPFFTTKEEGSGIGLSLSKQIMRVCGGTLSLRPYTNADDWTTFVVCFLS